MDRSKRPPDQELAWLSRQCITRIEAAERYGVHERTFGRWLREAGIRWPHRNHQVVEFGRERVTIAKGSRRASLPESVAWKRYRRGLRGDALWAPADRKHSRRPADHYELGLDGEEWDVILEVYHQYIEHFGGDRSRAKRATESKFGIPSGAIGAAENNQWHRLG